MKLLEKLLAPGAALAAGLLAICLLAAGLWPTSASASANMAAAGAAATREANACGTQFSGGPLYTCLGKVIDKLGSRIEGDGQLGASLAAQMRTAAAAIRGANKGAAVAALGQVRNAIAGAISRMKGKGKDDTPGMNNMSSAISATIRLIQAKG